LTAPLPRTVERAIPPEPHVVIVGAGFAGLALAQGLGGTAARVTVVDRNNYHLFVPLLYQVATAALSPADVAAPIRSVLARHPNIEVIHGAVTRVDTSARTVQLHSGERLGYDVLALDGLHRQLLRPCRLVARRAVAEIDRRRPRDPHARALRVRTGRTRGAGRTRCAVDLHRRRWRADRGGAGGVGR
jgi:hypothetical protein